LSNLDTSKIDLSKIPPGMIGAFVPARKAYKIEQMKLETKVPGAKRVKVIYGPYKLQAANVGSCIPAKCDQLLIDIEEHSQTGQWTLHGSRWHGILELKCR
jgi:hypothetical protein